MENRNSDCIQSNDSVNQQSLSDSSVKSQDGISSDTPHVQLTSLTRRSLLSENKRLRNTIRYMNADKVIRCRFIARQNEKICYLEDTLDRRTCFEILATILFTLFALIVMHFC